MSGLFSFLGPPCSILVELQGAQRTIQVPNESGTSDNLALYHSTEPVKGRVHIKVNPGKKIDHAGVRVELIGQIELFYDRSNPYEFTSVVRELESPGEMHESKSYDFDFVAVEKQYESYSGINVKLRYFVRVTIARNYSSNIVKEEDFWVHNTATAPEVNNPMKMEVGIEDSLHIEFEYCKGKYHLRDVVVGKIYFLLVRIKIKHMELAIIRRESTGSGPNLYNESETITKYEIMDGAPVRGESIPIRMFLSAYDLTPTYRNVNNKFSVKYYLNLVLVDEEDRRYFKQQEIQLYRNTLM
eukprot:TRINITY_DN3126_c0_g3_i1.p1 TRINITY_DN3126_c0_g3~~TRINITY_DN3126_c0_g3_i1.p1  ORF type:complete len:310 (-),score=54.62 TRINITY_DN3126_c0_g3_i1:641-1537(-)